MQWKEGKGAWGALFSFINDWSSTKTQADFFLIHMYWICLIHMYNCIGRRYILLWQCNLARQ